MKVLGLALASVALTAVAAPASAAVYMFNFTSATFSGSGTFTTSNTANANGSFTITNTTGSGMLNGTNYTFSGPNSYAGADNQLFVNRPAQLLSFDGTSFALSTSLNANIYFSNGYQYIRSGGAPSVLTSFAISAVPEPATWLTMLFGFAMVGVGLRARRTRIAFAV